MKKSIWIINQCASTLRTGFGGRHYYFAKELSKKGYDVHLFSSSDHHLLRSKPPVHNLLTIEEVDGFKYVWIKTLNYDGAHDKKRILSEFDFLTKISRLHRYYNSPRPDVILYSSPSLIPYLGAKSLAQNLGVDIVLDIRDLWPLTLTEMGVSKFHPFVLLLDYIQRVAYKSASHIISNWPYSIDYMEKRGASRENFSWIPNGFSPEEFDNPEDISLHEFRDLIETDKFVVGYAGTVGKANALETFIEAASLLSDRSDICFVIVGSGTHKESLIRKAVSRNLDNVWFYESVSKNQIPSILSKFDACYVGFHNIPLYRYGSSLTKLPEYLASSRPIIYASSSPFQPIRDASAGITIEAGDARAVADAIVRLRQTSISERLLMGENGRKAARSEYDYSILADKLASILFR
ncbi:Alpha-D-kanosaminyltransferase [Marinobacterium sp. xm-d-579]|uniref:glycosyltransferase family 4 protein n=1 Tax=Marinobacterium sp. xm-d-579 TaxID=2497734 RepID=UPI001568C91F|nr:glycosyltransferase family 4 protein [Marinobacterium sp. xm-d-579]NRP35692.1 Alpha-D-kanosaminyltransferase [Marinobacterium sp. xm-d-579]